MLLLLLLLFGNWCLVVGVCWLFVVVWCFLFVG